MIPILSTRPIGPEDWLEFLLHYLPSVAASVLATLGILLLLYFMKSTSERRFRETAGICVAIAPILIWTIYFFATSDWTLTLTLLNSEDDRVAEQAYETRLRRTIADADSALRLLERANHRESNLRFYAACRLAELLKTNSDSRFVEGALNRVSKAPNIQTAFFGTNSLNKHFYEPGKEQVKMPARELVQRMMNRAEH